MIRMCPAAWFIDCLQLQSGNRYNITPIPLGFNIGVLLVFLVSLAFILNGTDSDSICCSLKSLINILNELTSVAGLLMCNSFENHGNISEIALLHQFLNLFHILWYMRCCFGLSELNDSIIPSKNWLKNWEISYENRIGRAEFLEETSLGQRVLNDLWNNGEIKVFSDLIKIEECFPCSNFFMSKF